MYVCALLTFLLVTVAQAGAGDTAWWPAFVSTALMPFAFLGGLLRSHVSRLDAELRARLEELRASRARLVRPATPSAGGWSATSTTARSRASSPSRSSSAAPARAPRPGASSQRCSTARAAELQAGLDELRELARGIHPAVLTDRGLEPALQSLVARAPVPVSVEAHAEERLPGPVESAAYFVVSEALANVAKYARATHAEVAVRRDNGRVTVEVTDDGVGGADAARGSGLRGLADRVAALDGTLSLDSPAGRGTRVRAEIPCAPPADG